MSKPNWAFYVPICLIERASQTVASRHIRLTGPSGRSSNPKKIVPGHRALRGPRVVCVHLVRTPSHPAMASSEQVVAVKRCMQCSVPVAVPWQRAGCPAPAVQSSSEQARAPMAAGQSLANISKCARARVNRSFILTRLEMSCGHRAKSQVACKIYIYFTTIALVDVSSQANDNRQWEANKSLQNINKPIAPNWLLPKQH